MRLDGSFLWKRAFASGSRAVVATVVVALAISHGAVPRAEAATPALKYVALGDSIPIWNDGQSYPADYSARTAADLKMGVNMLNLGAGGWASGDVLWALRTNDAFRTPLAAASVVTWGVGLNDLRPPRLAYKAGTCGGDDNQNCLRDAMSQFEPNFDAIVAEVRVLNSNPLLMVRVVDVYNPFAATDAADDSLPTLKPYFDAMNAYIHATSSTAGIPTASVYLAFNGVDGTSDPAALGYLAPDGVHPSIAGSAAIAEALRVLAYEPLAHDGDADLVVDDWDNCQFVANPSQANRNAETIPLPKPKPPFDDFTNVIGDFVGDACETDIDYYGIPNGTETTLGLSPFLADTDADRTNDGTEVACGSDPLNVLSKLTGTDADLDGLPDACELTYGTDPNNIDSDGDKLHDGWEVRYWMSNPHSKNTDADGCTDDREVASVNNDFKINTTDMLMLAQRFNSSGTAPEWGDLDMNGDGKINSTDMYFVAQRFGYCAAA